MKRVFKAFVCAMAVSAGSAWAQDSADWQKRLVERPLYLRGFWQENTLELDAMGKPMKPARPGPLTLSGMDVKSVSVKGPTMVVRGNRVALVAAANGRLERRTPESSTLIMFSMLKNNVFKAKEEMKVTLHADAQGSFEAPVKAVFADGLKDFATGLPLYWACYAQGYLLKDLPDEQAEQTTIACLKALGMDDEVSTNGEFRSPTMVGRPQLQVPAEVFELGTNGRSVTRVLIGKDGTPLALQVVRPLGAGLDEEVLQAESRVQYRPATIDGNPVKTAMDLPIDFTITHR